MGIGNFIQGAIGGGLGGSTLGPWGAVGGALLGGAASLFGSDPNAMNEEERRRYLASIANRQNPALGPANQADYSGFRDNQAALISRLEAMSRGEGPSVSREMLNEATNRNIASQNAIAAGGRGGNLGAMVAANNTGRLGAQAAQDAALGRVQEQNNAINNLGMQIYSGRGADEDMNRFNTAARNNFALQNAQNQLQFWNQQDQANLGGMGMARPGSSTADQIAAGGAGLRAWYDANNAQRGFGNQPQGQGQPNSGGVGSLPKWWNVTGGNYSGNSGSPTDNFWRNGGV